MSASDDRAWALGIFFIVLVAALWAGSSVMIQYIYENLSYEEPFVLTYIGTSLFFIYIPGWFLWEKFGFVKNPKFRAYPYSEINECWSLQYEMVPVDDSVINANSPFGDENDEQIRYDHGYIRAIDSDDKSNSDKNSDNNSSCHSGISGISDDINSIISPMCDDIYNNNNNNKDIVVEDLNDYNPPTHVMSHLGTMRVSLIVCPLWFLANWTYNQSLSMTSVTSSTIISTTSSLFSFILSVIFTGEKFTKIKLFGVLFCMGGTVLITLSDQHDHDTNKPTNEFLGTSYSFSIKHTVIIKSLFSSLPYSSK